MTKLYNGVALLVFLLSVSNATGSELKLEPYSGVVTETQHKTLQAQAQKKKEEAKKAEPAPAVAVGASCSTSPNIGCGTCSITCAVGQAATCTSGLQPLIPGSGQPCRAQASCTCK